MRDLIIQGMHGLGDNIHQRALMRQLMRTNRVWLRTPWPCVYHDLVGDKLRLVATATSLRTQGKNAQRESQAYFTGRVPAGRALQVNYPPAAVRAEGSVLGALLKSAGGEPRSADFSLPVPKAWMDRAAPWLARWGATKPLLLFRPLHERKEWSGCAARNPDHESYTALLESIREHFFVVSIADLEPGKEWLVGPRVQADVECHAGELDFETIAALTRIAGLVFTTPGFMTVLTQAVGGRGVTVFGGYEDATSFSAGAHMAHWLPIEPIKPCNCFAHQHACDKRIDMSAALASLRSFVDETADRQSLAA